MSDVVEDKLVPKEDWTKTTDKEKVCPVCSATVKDPAIHRKWHIDLNENILASCRR